MVSNGPAMCRAIAVKCRETGDRGNLNAMRRAIRVSAKPLLDATREQARERLPKGGGLNVHVADGPMRATMLTGARSAGVRLKALQTDTSQTDQGYVRHPVYGYWRKGVPNQPVPAAAGWWTKTLLRKAPIVRAAIEKELRRVAAWLEAA